MIKSSQTYRIQSSLHPNKTDPDMSVGACNDHIRAVGRMNSKVAAGVWLGPPAAPSPGSGEKP